MPVLAAVVWLIYRCQISQCDSQPVKLALTSVDSFGRQPAWCACLICGRITGENPHRSQSGTLTHNAVTAPTTTPLCLPILSRRTLVILSLLRQSFFVCLFPEIPQQQWCMFWFGNLMCAVTIFRLDSVHFFSCEGHRAGYSPKKQETPKDPSPKTF